MVAPFVLLLLVAGSDLARAYFVGIQVADGARQAALFAADNPGVSAGAIAAVAEKNTGSNGSGLAATVLDCPAAALAVSAPAPFADTGGAAGFDDQKVTVTCRLPLFTPLLPSPVSVSATAVGLVAVGVLSVTPATLPDAVQGAGYSGQLSAGGGVAPYSWTQLAGALPPGLSLDPAGAITGTPTSVGTYTVTVLVTDSTSPSAETATATMSINVRAPLAITTASVPSGKVGSAYSTTLAASGGATPYRWTISTGSLPSGLTLDPGSGTISGVPSAAGSSTFTATVTDGTAPTPQSAGQSFTLAVGP